MKSFVRVHRISSSSSRGATCALHEAPSPACTCGTAARQAEWLEQLLVELPIAVGKLLPSATDEHWDADQQGASLTR